MTISLLHGDCISELQKIDDNTVDLVLTDPPYGTTKCKWDVVIDFDDMWRELKRVVRPNGAILLFGSEPFSSMLRVSNINDYRYDIYWKKEKPTNFMQLKRRVGKVTENVCVFYKQQCTYNPQKTRTPVGSKPVTNKPSGTLNSIVSASSGKKITPYNDDGTRYPIDVVEFNRVTLGHTVHPTQKPVPLLEYLIKTFSNENDIVLDFTMGSGSTGVACNNTNRSFIGIERDDDYYKIAVERIKGYKK